MKWFNNWFRKKCEEAWNESRNEKDSINMTTPKHLVSRGHELSNRGMNFTLHSGVGGYAVEIRSYNKKTDIHDVVLHIISSDKDLGQSLTQIMTYELLKQ